MPDRLVRWKASAARALDWNSTGEVVSYATHAGRVYRLCQRVEKLREALTISTDPLVVAALKDDADCNEDEESI
jgi:hypothetical protein